MGGGTGFACAEGMEPDRPIPSGLSELARDILAYLEDHGDARDSLEGILEWWLLERELVNGLAKVKGALRELVAMGLVEEVQRTGVIRFRAIPSGR